MPGNSPEKSGDGSRCYQWDLIDFPLSQDVTQGHFNGGETHKQIHMWMSQKILGPFRIHILGRLKLSPTKQVLPGRITPWDQAIQLITLT